MATVKELKATARPAGGKGAARAERRAGRVPGVIYGNNQPPVTISVDDTELRQRILAGRFLTTIYDIDLEGKKHRVIPRDFHLDPVRDFPLHVDFMRLGEGATIRVSVPLHIQNARNRARREARRHRQHRHPHHRAGMLGRQHSAVHRGRCQRAGNQPLAASVRDQAADRREVAVARGRDAGDHRAAVRLRRRTEGCGCRCGRSAAAAPVPLRRPALPLRRRRVPLPRQVPRLRRPARRRLRLAATRRSNRTRDAASCDCLSVSAIPARNTRITGTISASWPSMKLRGVTVSHHGAAVFRARPRKARSIANGSSCCKPTTFMNEFGTRGSGSCELLQARRRRDHRVSGRARTAAGQGARQGRRRHRRP